MLTVYTNQRGINMQKRRAYYVAECVIAACLMLILGGCAKDSVKVSSVTISQEGNIEQEIVGSFDSSDYDLDEFIAMAENRVMQHCLEHGPQSVELGEVKEKDGYLEAHMKYASCEDYDTFNNREFFVGKVWQAKDAGYDLDKVAFVSADGAPYESVAIEGFDDLSIAVVATKPDEDIMVNLFGKVCYINQSAIGPESVSIAGKKSVHITNPTSETEEDNGMNTLSYIIFE